MILKMNLSFIAPAGAQGLSERRSSIGQGNTYYHTGPIWWFF